MNKFAIYTACIGGYDNILQPETTDNRFDYILFSDEVTDESLGVWQVRHVGYTNPDKTRIARYVKTHPEELLPEYDATLWMDSSIQIVSKQIYDKVVDLYETNVDIASVKHPKRDCIYDEAYEVASRKKPGALEYEDIALRWCHKIWKDHYPIHNGLFETSILFRRNNEIMRTTDAYWWSCIKEYSKRDQLSFNYVLWKTCPTIEFFLADGEHMMNSEKLRYHGHSVVSAKKALSLNKFQLIRYRFRTRNKDKAQKQWLFFTKMPMPLLWLHTLGTLTALLHLVSFKANKLLNQENAQKAQSNNQ